MGTADSCIKAYISQGRRGTLEAGIAGLLSGS